MEGKLYCVLKEAGALELRVDGYEVYIEPPESPDERLAWTLYHPDILEIASESEETRFVVVECETAECQSCHGQGLENTFSNASEKAE